MTEYKEPLTKSDVQYDFTFVETFAGVGGVSFGFDAVGGKCVLAAEYDPTAEGKRQFAQDAYKALHPGTPVVGDIFKLDAKDVPDCDVLSFTTPCQSFSVAGKRLGFEDTRGTLVFEALRIAKEKRPKALFMENVKGLVNHDKGRTIDTILHAMNEVGYTVDFNVLNSKYFGVPQNRERVFIIALRDDLIDPQEWNPVGNTMLPKAKRRLKEAGLRTFNFDWPAQNEVTKRLRDVLEVQVDEKYYLSEDKTAKLVAELEAKNPNERMSRQAVETFNAVCTSVDHGDMIQAFKRQHITDGICPTLTTRPEGFKTAALPIVNGLPIREATTKGYAVAADGDAVNIQFPNSKTRRGRVGTQMANTLEASGCNQGVVVSESPVMLGHCDLKGHDAIKRVYSEEGQAPTLTTMGGGHREPKIAEEVFDEKERNAIKILRTLWGEVGTKTFAKWGFRVLNSLQQTEILQSGLYEEGFCSEGTILKRESEQSERPIESAVLHGSNEMPNVRWGGEFGRTSYGRESVEQRVEQLITTMSKLPFEDTQTKEILQDMWSEAQGAGLLRKALSEIQKIWKPTNDAPRYRIRKLTPRETMRLQGFPESVTDTLYAEGFSDSRIYKFAGNAVTTTVIKALGERLAPYLNEVEAK